MTKLMQWLTWISVYLAIWIAFYLDTTPFDISSMTKLFIFVSPVLLLASFGLYSVGVIAYRTATFNDCTEAAEELKLEIKEAQKDLQKRGFKFT